MFMKFVYAEFKAPKMFILPFSPTWVRPQPLSVASEYIFRYSDFCRIFGSLSHRDFNKLLALSFQPTAAHRQTAFRSSGMCFSFRQPEKLLLIFKELSKFENHTVKVEEISGNVFHSVQRVSGS